MDEQRLIIAAQKGSDAAFEELIEHYRTKIYMVCLRILRAEDDAQDAAQDCMIKVYLSLNRYHFRSSFATWVYSVARNTAVDHMRQRDKNKNISLDALPDGGESLLILEGGTGEFTEQNDFVNELIELVNKLPEEQRKCVILKDIDGYSCEEVSEITGYPPGTVKSRLHRGRERLQKLIKDRGLM